MIELIERTGYFCYWLSLYMLYIKHLKRRYCVIVSGLSSLFFFIAAYFSENNTETYGEFISLVIGLLLINRKFITKKSLPLKVGLNCLLSRTASVSARTIRNGSTVLICTLAAGILCSCLLGCVYLL